MTTYLEIKQWVQNAIGDADGTFIVSADLLRYANASQREIARKARCVNKLITGAQTLSNFDVYGGILLPTDFVVEDEVYFGSPLIRLERVPWDILWGDSLPAVGSTDQPTAYSISDYLTGTQIGQRHMVFYPFLQPGLTNKVVRIAYNAYPATLTADADVLTIPTQYEECMAWLMMANCKTQLDDFQNAQSLRRMVDDRLRELTSDFRETSGLGNPVITAPDFSMSAPWE